VHCVLKLERPRGHRKSGFGWGQSAFPQASALVIVLILATPSFLFSRGGASQAEILDRILVSFENTALTQSDVEQEYGFELFQDGKLPAEAPDSRTLQQTCERLVSQRLLALEVEGGAAVPEGLQAAAGQDLDDIHKRFADQGAYQSALASLGLSEEQVLARLIEHRQILQAIDQRLRPAAAPEATEVEGYYRETFAPEYTSRQGALAPPLTEVESQVRELVTEKKIDGLLAQWLEELKTSRQVRWHSF